MIDTRLAAATIAAGLLLIGGATATVALADAGAPSVDSTAGDAPAIDLVQADNDSDGASDAPIEDEYVEPAPEEGDPYFEAAASDGSWISYRNPRDEYRDPYLGDGSGKLCVALFNEDGEVVAGESVPNTTVEIPTGETIEWHSGADPMRVRFPLTDNYERPLDSDQFGTDSDIPQGDGYMDSHCIEFHGPSEDATIEYGEAEVQGERADWIDVVGYVQQEHEAWDTDVDPLADAEPYDRVGGWTYEPGASHGQAVVVLQLDPPEDAYADQADGPDANETDATDDLGDDADETVEGANETGSDANESTDGDGDDDSDAEDDSADEGAENAEDGDGSSSAGGDELWTSDAEDDSDDEGADSLPGFGVFAALTALATVAVARTRF